MRMILVAREADEFSRILTAYDYEVLNVPLVETATSEDLSDFESKLDAIKNYDGIFLTSRRATQIFAEHRREKNVDFNGKIYVLGKRSFDILKNENLDVVFDETANTAREMLEKIPSLDIQTKRFLFVRGAESLRVVPEFLSKTAAVDEAIVYQTREIAVEADELKSLREKLAAKEIAAACFFSPSGAKSFIKQFGAQILHQTPIATIGQTTAEFFARRNVKVSFVSPKTTAEDFAVALIEYLKGKKLTAD